MTSLYEGLPDGIVDDAVTLHTDDLDVARVVLRGEIDLTNASLLRAALECALRDHRSVDIDAGEVTFIDSSGVHAMLIVAKGAAPEAVTIRRASRPVRRIIALTGADAVLRIED